MPSLTSFSERKKLTLLQYGESGSGKSIRAASAAMWGPTYIFDFDGKIGSIYEFFKSTPKILDSIHYDTYQDSDPTKPTAAEAAYRKLLDIHKQSASGTCPYTTVVWDSYTAWEQFYLSHIMAKNSGFKRMRVEVGGGYVLVPDQADYRIHSHAEWSFIPVLTSLPCNVIVNCHIQTKQDEATGAFETGIAAAGKLWKVFPKYFPEVHRVISKGNEFTAQVRSDIRFVANTRLRDVPANGIIPSDLTRFSEMALKKGDA